MNNRLPLLASLVLALSSLSTSAAPPSTAFTYQASLTDNGAPADGDKVMQFKMWNAASGGTQAGSTISQTVTVSNGLFTVALDFTEGKVSTASGQALWLEVIVEGVSLGRTPLTGALYSLSTRGITVNSSGNVGLGTPAPQARLDVDGEAYFRGNVGIGTATPQARLEVDGRFRIIRIDSVPSPTSGAGMEFYWGGGGGNQGIISPFDRDTNEPRNLILAPYGAAVGIGVGIPATTLDVNGAVTIRGGADIVEGFDSACGTAFEPGTVLVIDPANPGKLMCSEDAYDGKVAGVVSGANGIQPGIKLGQDGVMDGDIPVAMTGRVYVKASAENGPIQPGDLLTTSSLSGHAMRATDRELSFGTVIGKAMTALDSDTGLVLVLVNLQ